MNPPKNNVVLLPSARRAAKRISRCSRCKSLDHDDPGHAEAEAEAQAAFLREEREWSDERLRAEIHAEANAAAIAARLGAAAAQPAVGVDYSTKDLLAAYYAERKARTRAKGTLDFIQKHSKTLLRLLPASARDITHPTLLGYVTTRREEGAGEVVRKELHGVLRPALKLARKSELFERDPLQVIPDPGFVVEAPRALAHAV